MNGDTTDDGSAILWREPEEYAYEDYEVEDHKFTALNRRYVIGLVFIVATSAILGFALYLEDSPAAMHKTPAASAVMSAPPTGVANLWVPTPGPGITTAPTTVATQSTPVASPAPTAPPTPAATPDTAGTNLDQVTRALFQLKYSLDQHPDMSQLSQIYAPGSSAYNHFAKDMQTLVNTHTTGSQPPATVSAVDVLSMTPTTAIIRAHTQYANSAPLLETLHLIRGTDGQWRITDYVVSS